MLLPKTQPWTLSPKGQRPNSQEQKAPPPPPLPPDPAHAAVVEEEEEEEAAQGFRAEGLLVHDSINAVWHLSMNPKSTLNLYISSSKF